LNQVANDKSEFPSAWGYSPDLAFFDEMIGADGVVRPHWRALTEAFLRIGPAGFSRRWNDGRRLIHENGITYNVYGDPRGGDRPWPLDPIPLVVAEEDWATIEQAVIQRATLLNAMCADFYGEQRLLRERRFPAELVFRHPGFLRPCHGVRVPRNIYLHNYSADLARSADGRWWIMADRTQAPTGVGYALENRLVAQRVLPDVFSANHVRRLADSFEAYREMLNGLVTSHSANPRIVLLTPGPYSEAYFEHAFLARYLGYTLVEGGDLTVRDSHVYLKTLGRLLLVDVIIRRQQDSFCDPLELRENSVLGVPGLVLAVRSGNVVVVNALGSGLLESSAPAAFLPALSPHILGEDLRLPSVATWWCGDSAHLNYILANLARLVVKPAFPTSRRHSIFGSKLSARALGRLADRIKAAPHEYVAHEQIALSTAPVWSDGRLSPRHLVLWVFAFAGGDSYRVVPGGFTWVSSGADNFIASMREGGGSKDTWVKSSALVSQTTLLPSVPNRVAISRAGFDLPSRVADNLFWLGRYVERIDALVRVARVILSRLQETEEISSGVELAVRTLHTLGYLPLVGNDKAASHSNLGRPHQLEDRILAMIYDSDLKYSVSWTLDQLYRVAWLLRDRFSADAWSILHRFSQQFTTRPTDDPLRLANTRILLDDALMTLSAFSGFAAESMTRGDGWCFFEIGRRVERALQMIELLRHGLRSDTTDPLSDLQTLLEIADSSLTYRSRYLTSMQVDLVIDLILLDEVNPRAVAFQLVRLREHVEELPKSLTYSRHSSEIKIVMQLLMAVQLVDASELVRINGSGSWNELNTLLIELGNGLRALSETLGRHYFEHTLTAWQMTAL
jgi:uncharacterized circularly permuted ATP-grasp superfamily protein/uncharacterized alpha-E superfamily protein